MKNIDDLIDATFLLLISECLLNNLNDDDFVERYGTGSDKKPDLSQFDANNREALYNDNFGSQLNSSMFRYAFYGTDPLRTIKEEMIPELIAKSNEKYGKNSPIDYQCFYKEGWADVDSNPHWVANSSNQQYRIYTGCPHDIVDNHAFFTLKRQNGQNVISVGGEIDAALSFTFYLHKQLASQNSNEDRHYFLWVKDPMALNPYNASIISESSKTLSVTESALEAELLLDKILKELEDRKAKNNTKGGKILIDIFDIARFKPNYAIIYSILKDGPYYGVFTCLYASEYKHIENLNIIKEWRKVKVKGHVDEVISYLN